MFEKEAHEFQKQIQQEYLDLGKNGAYPPLWERIGELWGNGAEFGYNKGKEELTERLDNATEIIELMKDLFFDCWQEKGLKAIKFEQRVNDFLKGE